MPYLFIFFTLSVIFFVGYSSSFFFKDTATTEIYTLSLHDALPIFGHRARDILAGEPQTRRSPAHNSRFRDQGKTDEIEEHTSELQSRFDLVCRLLLEKKKSY